MTLPAVPYSARQDDSRPALAIEAHGITKSFVGTRALDAVDFEVARGEVHGLVGKNGAGKSTFMKILSGAQAPDAGEIVVGGKAFKALSPAEGRAAGISIVYQNPELHLDLSVGGQHLPRRRAAQGHGPDRRPRDGAACLGAAVRALACRCPSTAASAISTSPTGSRSPSPRRCGREAHVLLLDEPTAALNKTQADFLFRLIRDLARQGMAVVYVSHHLDEVLAIADRITGAAERPEGDRGRSRGRPTRTS